MKTPPPWQAQLQLAERLVAGILQQVFRVNSNARLRSRNELQADLLALDGVAGAERRDAPRRKYSGGREERREQETQTQLRGQSDLIVARNSEKQKQRVKVPAIAVRGGLPLSTLGKRWAVQDQRDLRPRVRTKPVFA